MLRLLVLALILAAPMALAQTGDESASILVPRTEADRSIELSGFTYDVPDGWLVSRQQGGEQPMVQIEPVLLAADLDSLGNAPEVTALVVSMPPWRDRTAVGQLLAESFELSALDTAWTEITVGIDSASVRAYSGLPGAPLSRTVLLTLEADGRVAAVFLSTSEAWTPERLRATAVEVASGLTRLPADSRLSLPPTGER